MVIEVSALALIGAAFTIVLPFLILISIMFAWINRRMDRIEDRLDRLEDRLNRIKDEVRGIHEELARLTVRFAVLEEHERSTTASPT